MEAAAKIICAKTLYGGIRDELAVADLETRLLAVDLLRASRPDVILTHSPYDYHGDHRITSQLVFEAAPVACVRRVERDLPELTVQPIIYYMDTLGGIGFTPTEYVDITHTIEIKKRMFACHESQRDYMAAAAGRDFIELIETVARFRGYASGVPFAEGFMRCEAWYRGGANRVLP
jgi:LmbE family N-acetylglucosaminyl deacetylase